MFDVHYDERICSSVLICDSVRCSSDDGNKTFNGFMECHWKRILVSLYVSSHSIKDRVEWKFVHFSIGLV